MKQEDILTDVEISGYNVKLGECLTAEGQIDVLKRMLRKQRKQTLKDVGELLTQEMAKIEEDLAKHYPDLKPLEIDDETEIETPYGFMKRMKKTLEQG